MKEEKSFQGNIIYNLLYQISVYVLPMVTAPYVSRVLGSALVGRYSYAQSIASFFVLGATMGTNIYGQRKIASLSGQAARQEQAFWEIVIIRLITAIAATILFACFVIPGSVDPLVYLFAAIEILAVGVDISWYFQGKERFDCIVVCSVTAKLLAAGLIFVMVREPADLWVYVLLLSGAIFIGFFAQWIYLPKMLHQESADILRNRQDNSISALFSRCKIHFLGAFALFAAQVAVQIYTVLDKTMIGVITGSEVQNGYYEQAQKIIRILVAASTAISTVMASRVAVLYAQKKQEQVKEMIWLSFRVVACMALPIACGIFLVGDWFVPIFFGEGFEGVTPLLYILCFQPLIIGCSNVVGMQYLVPTGQEKSMTRSVIIGSVVNVILNAFLIQKLGAVGAAIASVIAEISVTGMQLWMVRGQLPLWKLPVIFGRYLLLCLPMVLVAAVLRMLLAPGTLVSLGVIGVSCVVIYGAELLLTKDPIWSILK